MEWYLEASSDFHSLSMKGLITGIQWRGRFRMHCQSMSYVVNGWDSVAVCAGIRFGLQTTPPNELCSLSFESDKKAQDTPFHFLCTAITLAYFPPKECAVEVEGCLHVRRIALLPAEVLSNLHRALLATLGHK
jgi:hypothetical protein